MHLCTLLCTLRFIGSICLFPCSLLLTAIGQLQFRAVLEQQLTSQSRLIRLHYNPLFIMYEVFLELLNTAIFQQQGLVWHGNQCSTDNDWILKASQTHSFLKQSQTRNTAVTQMILRLVTFIFLSAVTSSSQQMTSSGGSLTSEAREISSAEPTSPTEQSHTSQGAHNLIITHTMLWLYPYQVTGLDWPVRSQ